MFAILLMLQAAPQLPPPAYPNPSPEAITLGTRLAETGTLARLLPIVAAKESDEMVAAHPELSAAEQAELRRTATATLDGARTKLFAAEGRAWAERLSPADLRALTARNTDPLADRYRAALPAAIMAAMGGMDGFDFKKDTLAAFCAKTGKACAK